MARVNEEMGGTKMKMALELTLVIGLIGAGADVFACNIQDASDEPRPTAEIGKTPVKPTAPVTGPKELIDRIADDIRDNYARVRTVRTILQTTSSDRSVTKREEVTNKMPNGLTVQFVREPFTVWRERISLRGDDLLREGIGEDGEIWSFHGGIWTQYVPKHNTAWLRLPEQMPGVRPLDPRNIASMEQRSLFVDSLRADRVIEAGPARTLDGQPRITALMEHTFDAEHKERYRCEFDTIRNNLPTRVIILRDLDPQKIGIVLDITYQEVIPGRAWFFKKATCRYFGREPVRSPDSEAWRQTVSVETKGPLHVNEPIDDDTFVVPIPPGTRISDAVHASSKRKGDAMQRRPAKDGR
jgi:hypothetical protein